MSLRFEYAVSNSSKTVLGRLFPGTDLVEGIIAICRESGIKNGSITSLIGSLERARFVYVNRDDSNKLGVKYSEVNDKQGPFEILSAQGFIGAYEDGTPAIHLHALFCDIDDRILGGHMMDTGNPTLITCEIAIQETNEIRLLRKHDQETGFPLFSFAKGEWP